MDGGVTKSCGESQVWYASSVDEVVMVLRRLEQENMDFIITGIPRDGQMPWAVKMWSNHG